MIQRGNALGSLVVSEQENEVLRAHGAAFYLQERMRDVTDLVQTYRCRDCGNLCIYGPEVGTECTVCQKDVQPAKVAVPFSLIMLTDYLNAMGLSTRYGLQDNKELPDVIRKQLRQAQRNNNNI